MNKKGLVIVCTLFIIIILLTWIWITKPTKINNFIPVDDKAILTNSLSNNDSETDWVFFNDYGNSMFINFTEQNVVYRFSRKSERFNVTSFSDGSELKEMDSRLLFVIKNAKFSAPYCCPPGALCERPDITFELHLKNNVDISIDTWGIDWCIGGNKYILEGLTESNNATFYARELSKKYLE